MEPHKRRLTFDMPDQSWDYYLAQRAPDYYRALWSIVRVVKDAQRRNNNATIGAAMDTVAMMVDNVVREYGLSDEGDTTIRSR